MPTEPSFGLLNYLVLALYLVGMVAIGLRVAGKQTNTEDFFLAGRRMPWLIVTLSVFATVVSGVTYMGIPGLTYKENFSFIVGICMIPITAPFIIWLFLPFYRRLNVTTSYEYINQRFGPEARRTVSLLFSLARLGWLGTVIYAPALALNLVTGLNLYLSIAVMGVVSTYYTMHGGMTAVIWTDVVQFVIMLVGAVWVAVVLVMQVPDGLPGIMTLAQQTGRLNFDDWGISLTQMTITSVAISYFFNTMHDYGVDQLSVQRWLTINSYRGMVKAILTNGIVSVLFMGLLGFLGLGLLAYYTAYPAMLAPNVTDDQLLPYFMMNNLPAGVSGLAISAIFAAAMSSLSSGINTLTTVVINDLICPLRPNLSLDGEAGLRLARWLSIIFGVFATFIALFASTIDQLLKSAQMFLGLFSGPILALFLLGILTRSATFAGWLTGTILSLGLTVWMMFFTDVHFIYYFPFSFLFSLILGWLGSQVIGTPHHAEELLLFPKAPALDSTQQP